MTKLLMMAGLLVCFQAFMQISADLYSGIQGQTSAQSDGLNLLSTRPSGSSITFYSPTYCERIRRGEIALNVSAAGYQQIIELCRKVGVDIDRIGY